MAGDFNNDFNNDFDTEVFPMTLLELIESHPSYVDATNPTDQVILDFLNETVSRNKTSLTGDEVFQATEAAGWTGLTADEKNQWLAFCGRETIDPFGSANVALVTAVFGGGSATVTSLASLRTEQVDRVTNAGISRKNLGISLVNKVRNA